MENITLNKLAYDIFEFYQSSVKDTSQVDIRQIKYWIDTLRTTLIKRHLDKYPFNSVDENLVQSISPIQMELVDSSVYSQLPANRYYCRSTIAIPATIEKNGGIPTFTRIGPADRLSEKYQVINVDWAQYYGNGKFNKSSVAAFVLGDRIVLMSKDKQAIFGTKYIDVRGVFQNPRSAALITNPLYSDNDNYPINMQYANEIKEIILSREFRFNSKPPIDTQPVNQEQLNKQE